MKDYRAEIERVLKDEFDPNFVPHARCLLRELLGWFEAMDSQRVEFTTRWYQKADSETIARDLERLETLQEILHGGVKWDAIKHMLTEEETSDRYGSDPTDPLTQNSWKCSTCNKQLTWHPDETYSCECRKYTKIPIEDEEDPITPDPVTEQYEARQDRLGKAETIWRCPICSKELTWQPDGTYHCECGREWLWDHYKGGHFKEAPDYTEKTEEALDAE